MTARRLRQGLVLVLAVLVLVIGAFSTFALVGHNTHFCVEDDCPICICLARLQEIFRQLTTAVGTACGYVLSTAPVAALAVLGTAAAFFASPVALKTRMDD